MSHLIFWETFNAYHVRWFVCVFVLFVRSHVITEMVVDFYTFILTTITFYSYDVIRYHG